MYSTQALSYHSLIYKPAPLFLPSSYKERWISYRLLTEELMMGWAGATILLGRSMSETMLIIAEISRFIRIGGIYNGIHISI